jgi:hypothetical protein
MPCLPMAVRVVPSGSVKATLPLLHVEPKSTAGSTTPPEQARPVGHAAWPMRVVASVEVGVV